MTREFEASAVPGGTLHVAPAEQAQHLAFRISRIRPFQSKTSAIRA
jgi:hypothetical protein